MGCCIFSGMMKLYVNDGFELEVYLAAKVLHIVGLFAWFAGLFYLPRLFVYHTTVVAGSEAYSIFCVMERKLFCIIMLPAMIISVLTAMFLMHYWILLTGIPLWIKIKMAVTFLLVVFTMFLYSCLNAFAYNVNQYSNKFYRIINEFPTVMLILAVLSAVYKW